MLWYNKIIKQKGGVKKRIKKGREEERESKIEGDNPKKKRKQTKKEYCNK